jgi:hypothetical protein
MAGKTEGTPAKKVSNPFNRFIITNSSNPSILFFEEMRQFRGENIDEVLKVLRDFSSNPEAMQDGKLILLSTAYQRIIVQTKDSWIFAATMADKPTKDDYRLVNNIVKRVTQQVGQEIYQAVTGGRKDLRDIIRTELGVCKVDEEMAINVGIRNLIDAIVAEYGDPTFLREGFQMDIETRKTFLEKSILLIDRWRELRARAQNPDLYVLGDEIAMYQSQMGNPKDVEGLSRALVALEKKAKALNDERAKQEAEDLKRMEKEVQALNGEIQELEGMGFRVASLRRLLATGDTESTRNSIMAFKLNIDQLSKMRSRLDAVDTAGFEQEVENLHMLLTDPANLIMVQGEFDELMAVIGKEKGREKKLLEMEGKLRQWEGEGYTTAPLYDVLTKNVEMIIDTFQNFETHILILKDIQNDMKDLDRSIAALEYDRLASLMKDPWRVDEAQKIHTQLKEHLGLRTRLDNEVKQWSAEGYDVSALRVARTKEFKEYTKQCEDLRSKIEMLKICAMALQEMRAEATSNEVALVSLMLKDVKKVEDVKASLHKLKKKIVKERSKTMALAGPPIKDHDSIVKVLRIISKGMTGTLWGKPLEELAAEILEAEYWESPEGELLVRLGRKWYFGDPYSIWTFMRPYEGNSGQTPSAPKADKEY